MSRQEHPRDNERVLRMGELYRSGKTLHEIGAEYGVCRERVRQLIKSIGMNRDSGGHTLRVIENARARHTARRDRQDAKYMKVFGCSKSVFVELTGMEWRSAAAAKKNPGVAYYNQCRKAGYRGIEWNITFPEWWRVWQESGKWERRGRGKGYCMARHGDSGPYSVENVYICTIGQNFSDSYLTRPWKDRVHGPYSRKPGRGYSVSFSKRHKSNPFQLYIGPKYSGMFPSREAAEQAAQMKIAA